LKRENIFKNQHDRFYCEAIAGFPGSVLAFVLDGHCADTDNGHHPSEFVVATLPQLLADRLQNMQQDGPPFISSFVGSLVRDVVDGLHDAFVKYWDSSFDKKLIVPGTMLTGAIILPGILKPDELLVFNIGDSETHVATECKQLSDILAPTFQTVCHDAPKAANISPNVVVKIPGKGLKAAMFFKDDEGKVDNNTYLSFSRSIGDTRKSLSEYIGRKCDVDIITVKTPTTVVLASDGWWDIVSFLAPYPTIMDSLKAHLDKARPDNLAEAMVQYSQTAVKTYGGGKAWDNTTVVSLCIGALPSKA